jgi:hypothetical protein
MTDPSTLTNEQIEAELAALNLSEPGWARLGNSGYRAS